MRLLPLLLLLALSSCAPAGFAALSLALTIADKALGVTDGIIELIHDTRPTTTPPAPIAPKAIGWALNGERQDR